MSAIISAATTGLIQAVLSEFVEYQKRRALVEGWKPGDDDVAGFVAKIDADSPEALKAKVAALLGIQWPPQP